MWFCNKYKYKEPEKIELCEHKRSIEDETKFIRSYNAITDGYLSLFNSIKYLVFQKVCSSCYLYFRTEEVFNPDSIKHRNLLKEENATNRRK